MAKIVLSPHAAPLAGFSKPTLGQISAVLARTPKCSWSPARPDERKINKALSRFFGFYLIFGTLLTAGLGMVFFTPAPPAQPKVNLSEAQTVYAIIAQPGPKMLEALAKAQAAGVKVRLVTANPPPDAAYDCVKMDLDAFKTEGILVDGVRWVPIK